MLLRLRSQLKAQDILQPAADSARQALLQRFSAKLVWNLESLLDLAEDLPSDISGTRKALDLAQKIIALLEQESEQPTKKAVEKPTRACSNADDSPRSEEPSSPPQQTDAQSSGASKEKSRDAAAHALQSSKLPKDLFDQLAKQLKADAVSTPISEPVVECSPPSSGEICVTREAALASSGTLRRALQVLLEAQERSVKRPTHRGRVQARSLWKVKTEAQPKVFTKQYHHRGTNTAVHLLLDQSASMAKGDRMEVATQAAAALAAAIEPMRQTTMAVTAFPAMSVVTCTGVYPLVRRGQRLPKRLHARPWGATPMAEAMHYAAKELVCSARMADRRVLIVITDGQPSEIPAVKALLERLAALNVEVIGLGISLPAITKIFPKCRVITDLSQLAPTLFEVARTSLA